MAKFRYVNTGMWDDDWFSGLDALEQHLFIYLLTNANTTIGGVYQIALKRVAFDSGMDQEKVKKILLRFEADSRVYYERGWVIMVNWLKHQTPGPKIGRAVANHFNALPDWLREALSDKKSFVYMNYESLLIPYGYGIDTLSHEMTELVPKAKNIYPMDMVSYNSNSNSNSNINSNINSNSNSNGKLDSKLREDLERKKDMNK